MDIRNTVLAAGAAAAALALVGCGTPTPSGTAVEVSPRTEEPEAAEAAVTDSDSDAGSDTADDAEQGDVISSGGWDIVIDRVELAGQVLTDPRGWYDPETADGQWVVVTYTVTNTSSEPDWPWITLRMRADNGNLYGEDSDAGMLLESDFGEVNPGSSQSDQAAFDIPADVQPEALEISEFLDAPVMVRLTTS